MKKFNKILLSFLCAMLIAVPVFFVACDGTDGDGGNGGNGGNSNIETVDYAGQVELDLTTETKKQEVEVRQFIDGDTTHFDPVTNSKVTGYNKEDFAATQGFIKARYLAINTPESTGKIEKWGKAASNFTHDKLDTAKSIIVESDDSNWNKDSTGGRYTLWVWYIPEDGTEYRNLNIEILQEGYAVASNTGATRYGEVGLKAIEQAKALKLHVHAPANIKDPLFHEGDATHLSLKELRCHISDYEQQPVRVEGTVVAKFGGSAYIEDYDAESERYFGLAIYYGYPKDGTVEALSVGNRVSVYGKITEFNGSWQLSGVSKNEITPKPSTDIEVLDTGKTGAFVETSASAIINDKTSIEIVTDEGKEKIDLDFGEAIMGTTVTVKHLTVDSIYTTNTGGDSDGAMSITCLAEDGTKIVVRTEVLTENGEIVTQDKYEGQVITVKGLIDYYKGKYQIACWRADFITIE